MDTILCAIDGSESADQALDFAIDLASESHASLAVIGVLLNRFRTRGRPTPILPMEDHDRGRRVIDAAAEKARRAGITAYAVTGLGDPAEEIAAEAERRRADLVVVGSRGFGPVTGTLFGSVSAGVVKRSRVPVTVVAHTRVREAAAV